MKEEIIKSLISGTQDFEALVKDLDPKDIADIASDDIDRKTLEALSANDIRRLRMIDAALSRIKNGRFGLCVKCNKKISQERLTAIPYATMCIDCQNSDERRNR
jgi:RNA polymerase-binding transcription factor DksA